MVKVWQKLNNDHIQAAWRLDILPNSHCIQTEPDYVKNWPVSKRPINLWKKTEHHPQSRRGQWPNSHMETSLDQSEIRSYERDMFIAKKIQIGRSDHSTDIFGRTNLSQTCEQGLKWFDCDLGQEEALAIESAWSGWTSWKWGEANCRWIGGCAWRQHRSLPLSLSLSF